MTQLTETQAYQAAKVLQDHYGSFASAIACAYFFADSDNRAKLLGAFEDLFQRAYNGLQATQTL